MSGHTGADVAVAAVAADGSVTDGGSDRAEAQAPLGPVTTRPRSSEASAMSGRTKATQAGEILSLKVRPGANKHRLSAMAASKSRIQRVLIFGVCYSCNKVRNHFP